MIGSSRPPFCRLGEDTRWRGGGHQHQVAHGQGRRRRACPLLFKNDRQVSKDGEIFLLGHRTFLIVFFLGIKLPDMDFAINARSEGRVLVPWEYRNDTSITHQEEPFGVFWLPPLSES